MPKKKEHGYNVGKKHFVVDDGAYSKTAEGPIIRVNVKPGSTSTHNKSVRRRLAKGKQVKGK